jgi:hypothetical protein
VNINMKTKFNKIAPILDPSTIVSI